MDIFCHLVNGPVVRVHRASRYITLTRPKISVVARVVEWLATYVACLALYARR